MPEMYLSGIDTEHYAEGDECGNIQDHFAVSAVRERDKVEASSLKITNDCEWVVIELKQH
jgi:hypothetical protein